MTTSNLLVELLVEELPPKALRQLGDAFAALLFAQLQTQGLLAADSVLTPYASPRRLAAHISHVLACAPNKALAQKLMPISVGLDAAGQATPALLKKLQALGVDASVVPQLRQMPDGKAMALWYDSTVTGATLEQGLQKALTETIAKLPIPKVMGYQLADGWSTVHFVRPAHGLVALHGNRTVAVSVLGLQAGNSTQGHRFEAKMCPVIVPNADSYAATLLEQGAVIADFNTRRSEIVRQLTAAAAQVSADLGVPVQPIHDDALLDEVTGLVERPNVLVCEFEKEFLDVPQECLILTMKANQKYFPLLQVAQGGGRGERLTHQFLVVSNISPADASAVIGGNERVVRPRLADAKFFFDQDRKKPLMARIEGLAKMVYHNQLGSQGERIVRVRCIAKAIATMLAEDALIAQVDQAAQLAKTDLLTDMVGEFPELQGTMGRYYALNDKLDVAVADAIEDHYKPRFAGDSLPRNRVGVVVALADKLETLVGMFGIGNLPTGDKDPFALRRHALGVIRMLTELDLALDLSPLLEAAYDAFGATLPAAQRSQALLALTGFIYDRLSGALREQGYSAQEVDAVVAQRPQRLADIAKRLVAVRAFAALPEAPALAAANKRVGNILKKAGAVVASVQPALLQEPAEQALFKAMQTVAPQAQAQFSQGDYTASLQTLAALRAPVDAFFETVMVNAEDAALRQNRQGLLQTLYEAMNQVADLSKLAV